MIDTEVNIPITPKPFLGIHRKIAYANKKYHSGTICSGVDIILAMEKFSGSPTRYGFKKIKTSKIKKTIKKNITSLATKNGWKLRMLYFLKILLGFWLPVLCKKKTWSPTNLAIKIGTQKWIAKKRIRVAFEILNPPQTQNTISGPTTGIAEIKFVITVAPQYLIWPQGSTYPRNATIIDKINVWLNS